MFAVIEDWKLQFQQFNRNIRLFFLFTFVWNVGLGMFGLVYNLYVKALGHGQTVVGDVVGMTALASALVLIPAGLANDRFGPRRIMSIGLTLAIIAFFTRAFLVSHQGMVSSAFLGGMAIALVNVTTIPFLSNHSTPSQRVHLFSLNLAIVMLANVLGNLLGGSLTDLLQFGAELNVITSLRITLVCGACVAGAGLLPVLLFRSEESKHETDADRDTHLLFREAWQKHRTSFQVIGLFILINLLTSTAGGMVVPYLNVYFEDRFEASKTAIGLVVSLGQAATAVAFLIGPALARRIGEVRAILLLQLASIPFLLLTAYATSFYLASAGYLFRQALMNASTPFHNSVKMKYVHRSLRGLASSSGEAMFNLGWFIAAPLSTGLVAQYGSYHGYAYAFTITAVVYTFITVFFYLCFGKERFTPAEEEDRQPNSG